MRNAALATQMSVAVVVLVVAVIGVAVRAADTDNLLERSGEAMTDTGSYRFTMSQEFTGPQAGFKLRVEGVSDVERGVTRLLWNSVGGGTKATCTMIGTKESLFTKVHPTRVANIGGKWARTDLESLENTPPFGGTFGFNPERFRENAPEPKNLTEAGTSDVRGVATTRYTGEFDYREFVFGEIASPLPTTSPDMFPISIPVELFIDADGLMRRMIVTYEVTSQTAEGFGFTNAMEFFDFGEPVDINEPPAGDVKDLNIENAGTACLPAGAGPPSG